MRSNKWRIEKDGCLSKTASDDEVKGRLLDMRGKGYHRLCFPNADMSALAGKSLILISLSLEVIKSNSYGYEFDRPLQPGLR